MAPAPMTTRAVSFAHAIMATRARNVKQVEKASCFIFEISSFVSNLLKKINLPVLPCLLSHPCHNNGLCLDDNMGGYKCTCDTGYTGDNCEILLTCENHACNNNGVCVVGFNEVFCQVFLNNFLRLD